MINLTPYLKNDDSSQGVFCMATQYPSDRGVGRADFYKDIYQFTVDFFRRKYMGIILGLNCICMLHLNHGHFVVFEQQRGEK